MKQGVRVVRILAVTALIFAAGIFTYRTVIRRLYPMEYAPFVQRYAEEYEVPVSLVYAVIKCESGFDPEATSGEGAKGLMQMLDDTFQWVRTKDPGGEDSDPDIFDPQTNIKYGTLLLSLHRTEFGSDQLALAAYHTGRTRVNNWLSNKEFSADGKTLLKIPDGETSHYIDKVFSAQKMYQDLYGLE